MTTLKRLSVVMSVFSAGLVIAACASPTDDEISGQLAQEEERSTADGEDLEIVSSALEDDAEETAEDIGHEAEQTAEDVEHEAEQTAEDVADDDKEGSVAQEQRYGRRPGYGHGRRCDYRNVHHCVRNHRGWRWVPIGRSHGGYGRYGDHGRRHRDSYCCMRVHVRDHRGGPYGY